MLFYESTFAKIQNPHLFMFISCFGHGSNGFIDFKAYRQEG